MSEYIEVPIGGSSGELIQVRVDELGSDSTEIIAILRAERAPLAVILQFARVYFGRGDIANCLQILDSAPKSEMSSSVDALNLAAECHLNEQSLRTDLATSLLNEATNLDGSNGTTLCLRGQLLFLKGQYENALAAFEKGLQGAHENVLGLLGRAQSLLMLKKYPEAVLAFVKLLRAFPCDEAREGMGDAFFMLGDFKKARVCYEALGLKPKIALTFLKAGGNDKHRGMKMMRGIYDSGGDFYSRLHLAQHFLEKSQPLKAQFFAQLAVDQSNGVKKQVASLILAQCFEMQLDINNAQKYFALAGDSAEAKLGLAFCALHEMKDSKAADLSELILPYLKLYPKDLSASKLLIIAQSRDQRTEESARLLCADLIVTHASDFELQLLFAKLSEQKNHVAALQSYRKIAEKSVLPNEVSLNLAILEFECGDKKKALEIAREKFEELRTNNSSVYEQTLQLKFEFNVAVFSSNVEMLKDILHRFPTFIDCKLHLGILAMKKDLDSAEKYFNSALEQQPNCVEAHILLGDLLLCQQKTSLARKKYEFVLQKLNRHDCTALLALGNLYLNEKDSLKKAAEFYRKVLQLQPHNYAASNGLGAICLKKKRFLEAKQICTLAKNDGFMPAQRNLGHCLFALGQFVQAATCFELCGDLTNAARCLYFGGRNSDSNLLEQAIKYIEIDSRPDSQYNLAICKQECAQILIKQNEFDRAKKHLADADEIFSGVEAHDAKMLKLRVKQNAVLSTLLEESKQKFVEQQQFEQNAQIAVQKAKDAERERTQRQEESEKSRLAMEQERIARNNETIRDEMRRKEAELALQREKKAHEDKIAQDEKPKKRKKITEAFSEQ